MNNWREWFKGRHHVNKNAALDIHLHEQECMYQAFKARMMEELGIEEVEIKGSDGYQDGRPDFPGGTLHRFKML